LRGTLQAALAQLLAPHQRGKLRLVRLGDPPFVRTDLVPQELRYELVDESVIREESTFGYAVVRARSSTDYGQPEPWQIDEMFLSQKVDIWNALWPSVAWNLDPVQLPSVYKVQSPLHRLNQERVVLLNP
jgi:hypothetical protein